MKFRSVLSGVFCWLAVACSAWAQDVILSDFQWLHLDNAPADVAPAFTSPPQPQYPRRFPKDQTGYVIIVRKIDAQGFVRPQSRWSSDATLRDGPVWELGLSVRPATKDGHPVETISWYSVIFNAREPSPTDTTAKPRILAVAPIFLPRKTYHELVSLSSQDQVVWARVKLDAAGQPLSYSIEKPAHEKLRPMIDRVLPAWRFSPARTNGQAVAAELAVPFAVLPMGPTDEPPLSKLPKFFRGQRPEYPKDASGMHPPGRVLLEVVIDAKGNVTETTVLTRTNPAFVNEAQKAVQKWKFSPGRRAGKPVATVVRKEVYFNVSITGTKLKVESAFDGLLRSEPLNHEEYDGQRSGLDDHPPRFVNMLTPIYPSELLVAGVSGEAEVEFLVPASGGVQQLRVAWADHPAFGESLAFTVQQMDFIPAYQNGKTVNCWFALAVRFDAVGLQEWPSAQDNEAAQLLANEPEKVLSSSKELDKPVTPIWKFSPGIPKDREAPEGSAVVEFIINSEGYVCLPRIVSATKPEIGYLAMKTILRWKFTPPTVNGQPVFIRRQMPFVFSDKPPQPTSDSAVPSASSPARSL
jgi:TonB family protein